jgi:predicted metalloprotease with PDZ domain
MTRSIGWLLAGALVLGATASPGVSFAKDKEKKDRLTLQAQRAGWLLGMYIGEEKAQPNPFVVEVDPKSDAKIKGIRPGDELIRFDGMEADPLWRVFDRANELRPGKEIQVWLRRGVQVIRVSLIVPKSPGAAPAEKGEEKAEKKTDPGTDDQAADDKKKKKKKSPVVIKPIPAPGN